jgi:hypothetical protein
MAKYQVGQMITFRPPSRSRAEVTGPVEKIHVDDAGRTQYLVCIRHDERYVSGYWVWESDARPGGVQLRLL